MTARRSIVQTGHVHGADCDHAHAPDHGHAHVHGADCDHDHDHAGLTYVREEPKISRNDPCPCGSGKKYKKCHDPNG